MFWCKLLVIGCILRCLEAIKITPASTTTIMDNPVTTTITPGIIAIASTQDIKANIMATSTQKSMEVTANFIENSTANQLQTHVTTENLRKEDSFIVEREVAERKESMNTSTEMAEKMHLENIIKMLQVGELSCPCEFHCGVCCCDGICDYFNIITCEIQMPTTYTKSTTGIKDKIWSLLVCRNKNNNDHWCKSPVDPIDQLNLDEKKELYEKYYDSSSRSKDTWPESLLFQMHYNGAGSDYYESGDPLQLKNIKTHEKSIFVLPSRSETSYCDTEMRSPIRYLQSFKKRCLTEDKDEYLRLQSHIVTMITSNKIVKQPFGRNLENSINDSETPVTDLQIDLCSSEQQPKSCQAISKLNETTDDDFKAKNMLLFDNNYILEQINIEISFNTTEIIGVRIELWYANDVKQSIDERSQLSITLPKEYWLYMDVKFLNKSLENSELTNSNSVINDIKKDDGNDDNQGSTTAKAFRPLGYLQGKPIILAKILGQNHTNDKEWPTTMHADKTDNFQRQEIQITGKSRGLCSRDTAASKFAPKRYQILYGINLALNCKHRLNDALQKNLENVNEQPQNATMYCQYIQNDILQQLLGKDFNLTDAKQQNYYIAELGQPRAANIHDWTPFRIYNADYEDFVIGQFNAASNTLICRNIILNVAYEFLAGNFLLDNLPHQQLIKNAALRLGPQRHDIEFELHEILEIPLETTVRFFNLKEISRH